MVCKLLATLSDTLLAGSRMTFSPGRRNKFSILLIVIALFLLYFSLESYGQKSGSMPHTIHVVSFENFTDVQAMLNSLKEKGIIGNFNVYEIKQSGSFENKGVFDVLPDAKAHQDQNLPISANEGKMEASLYDNAMSDFESGKHEDALEKFKRVTGQNLLEADQKEAALRHVADCYYFLGKRGDKHNFFSAIEQYKDVIQKYPDSKKKNALALYRTAVSYERLKLYYEAIRELKRLYLRYPDSDHIPDVLNIMGRLYCRTKKFEKAIDNYRKYLRRFRDGKYVKDACFYIGDCYSLMGRFKDADRWYKRSLKKWPVLEDLPEEALMKLGSHYFRAGKYNHAPEVFFVYVNLYPEGEYSRQVLYKLALSFVKMDELILGLKTLSLVMERYPESIEAKESAVVMANIGVKDPGIRLPQHILCGMDYYRNPVETCDRMMKEFSEPAKREELLFLKGCALLKRERYREAFDTSYTNRYRYGKYRKAGERNLILSANHLVDQYFSKGDYVAVSDIYFKMKEGSLFEGGDFNMLFKTGISLKNIGLLNSASKVFKEMADVHTKSREKKRILLAMAEVDYKRGFYEDAGKRATGLLKNPSRKDKTVLISAKKLMGDICYKKGLFKEAAGFYSKVLDSGENIEGIGAVYKKYGDSLKETGSSSSALINYEKAIRHCSEDNKKNCTAVVAGSYEALGDCFFEEGDYRKSILMYNRSLASQPEASLGLWPLYYIGRGHLNLGSEAAADQTFNSLKEKSQDEFWTGIVDYFIDDKNWSRKYSEYLK